MGGYLEYYLQPLKALIDDPATIEIAVNADGRVWVERAGATHMAPAEGAELTPRGVTDLSMQIANEGRLSLTEDSPLISTTISTDEVTMRVQAVIQPAAANGTVLAFRLFRPRPAGVEPRRFAFLRAPSDSLEAERLKRLEQIRDLGQRVDSDAFLRAAVETKLNIVISGGTSTGKTELARRLQWMIPAEERLVLIEDSAELLPAQPNHVSLIASRLDGSARSAEKLLQATLRLRPDRIILGELRGIEAVTFLESINTGHGGSFTTLHAETARKALDRLALLVLAAGTQLTYAEVKRYLRGSIDVVIQTGRVDEKRGIMELYFPALDPAE